MDRWLAVGGDGVILGAAVDPLPADQLVDTAADEAGVAVAPVEGVVPESTRELVVSVAAEDNVVAVAGG
jgi:hypothetical protein